MNNFNYDFFHFAKSLTNLYTIMLSYNNNQIISKSISDEAQIITHFRTHYLQIVS